jgi:hypothetical protein
MKEINFNEVQEMYYKASEEKTMLIESEKINDNIVESAKKGVDVAYYESDDSELMKNLKNYYSEKKFNTEIIAHTLYIFWGTF